MEKFKKFICKLFHIETYEKKFEECNKHYEELKENYAIMLNVINSYKKDLDLAHKEIDRLNKLYEDPQAQIDKIIDEVSAQYEVCANEVENLVKMQDRIRNKAFAEGRAAAYSEMGIWRLDALEHGNRLVMDKNGDVFELLTVEDVECTDDINPEQVSQKDLDGEIDIDDLVDIIEED